MRRVSGQVPPRTRPATRLRSAVAFTRTPLPRSVPLTNRGLVVRAGKPTAMVPLLRIG
jgi:hypothetical protein